MEIDEETARRLSCNISIRPRSAPGISELLPHVRAVHRDCEAVTISFEASGENALNSFVEAERLCCTGLTWLLHRDDAFLKLRITGTEDQLAIIEGWFAPE